MMSTSYPAVSSELLPPSSGLVWAVALTPLLTPHSHESAGPAPRRFPQTLLLRSSLAADQKQTKHNASSDFCIVSGKTVVFLPMQELSVFEDFINMHATSFRSVWKASKSTSKMFAFQWHTHILFS